MRRFPFVKQHDAMQCGVACLEMVCRNYGRQFPISMLSQICHVTSEGVSMLGISEAANEIGFHSVCVRTTVDNLSLAPLPCILHWNQNHFVVLYKVRKGKRFYIADPGKGLLSYSHDEFKNHWVSTRSGGEDKGIAMLIEPTPVFYVFKVKGDEHGRNDQARSLDKAEHAHPLHNGDYPPNLG